MAIKPINYEIDQSQPIPFLEGMKEGLQLQEIRQKREAELARQEQEKQKILAEERRQQLYQRLLSPNVAPEDYKAALLVSDEATAKSIMQMMEQSDKAASRAAIVALSPVVSALHAGNPDRAISILEQRGKAYEGRPDVQEDIQNRINLIKASPESAKFEFGGELSVIPGGSDVLANILKLTEEKRAQSAEARAAELQPSALMEQNAKARKAYIESQYADRTARLTIQEKEQNIAAAKQQIKDARNAGIKVQSSSILPDGTVILVTTDGQSIVRDPEGNSLTGQSRRDAIFAAKNFGVDEQGQRSGARRGAEIGQKKSEEAFESLDKVNANIKNMNEAIAAIDSGASTGVISSKLPNVKQASIELNNIKNRLGLDVIGATTFGALSSSEREFALETAMPTNLQPRELRAWLVRKRDAQAKMSGYLSEQAKYLSKPGRTVGDWLDYQDKKKADNERKSSKQAAQSQSRNVNVDY